MELEKQQVIEGATIKLDGGVYRNVMFKSCIMVYSGSGNPVDFFGCSFIDCSWHFEGSAASTLSFVNTLAGAMGSEGKSFVMQMFKDVFK